MGLIDDIAERAASRPATIALSEGADPRVVGAAVEAQRRGIAKCILVGPDAEIQAAYIAATQPPTAAFDGSPRTGDRPLTVQFTDLSTAGSAPITTWSWSRIVGAPPVVGQACVGFVAELA